MLFQQVVELLQNARQQVLRTVNTTMVCTYFEIGRMIVEEEQSGKDRAEVPGFEALLHRFKRSISVLGRSQRTFESYSRNIATIVYCSIAISFQNTFCRSTAHSRGATRNNRLVLIFQFEQIITQCIHRNINGILNMAW